MSIQHIGTTISALRKEKGVTQEELAKHVGISAQAVSKWENGGVPDIELLPKIADYFGISIDRLFGREVLTPQKAHSVYMQDIADAPEEERFSKAFAYVWDIERALSGGVLAQDNDYSLDALWKRLEHNKSHHSSILFDSGWTRMSLCPSAPYFLMVPEFPDKEQTLLSDIDYPAFFKDMADKTVFDALVFLNRRDIAKSFTSKLLEKHLNISEEQALTVIATLRKYEMIQSNLVDIDDETREFFRFIPTPSFVALLIFAREMMHPPHSFTLYIQNRKRPYLS